MINTIVKCNLGHVFGQMLGDCAVVILTVLHSWQRSVTAAAVVAAVSSDAPEVSYACGYLRWQRRLAVAAISSALFCALMRWQPTTRLFSRSNDRLLLRSGTSNVRALI